MTQSGQSVLINGFGVLFVILNSFGLGLRLPVGKLLADAAAQWKIAVWALVINFVIIPLLFIGYLLTIASSIPGEIKVGFCVAALCAGMPFAPLLARLAKADVSTATILLVVLLPCPPGNEENFWAPGPRERRGSATPIRTRRERSMLGLRVRARSRAYSRSGVDNGK